MYFCRNIFLITVFFIFVTSTYSHINPAPTIQEKGSSGNNSTVQDTINHTILSVNNTQKPVLSSQLNVPPNSIQIASEGGGISPTSGTHIGREGVIHHPLTETVVKKDNQTSISHSTQPQDKNPIHETVIGSLDIAPQQDHEKQSVPKKGVDFGNFDEKFNSSFNNVTNNISLNVSSPSNSSIMFNKTVSNVISNRTSSTNTSVVHKKPLFTESDSDFVNMSKSNKDNSKEIVISIDQIDPLLVDKKTNRSDYIVPIVAVILSVPLVAILASIVYKRSTDWWQHRNYKRMDFLIEGMYHN